MLEIMLKTTVNDYHLIMVIWNLFLALIPCWTVYFMAGHTRGWERMEEGGRLWFLLLFLFWLFMLPNTAYLISVVRHLVDYCVQYNIHDVCPEGTWMVPLFFLYGLVGVITFVYSLRMMTHIWSRVFSLGMGRLLPLLAIPLTAFGLLLGLVDRYNSWDILMRPEAIVRTALSYLQDPIMLMNLGVYSGVLYLIYYSLRSLKRPL